MLFQIGRDKIISYGFVIRSINIIIVLAAINCLMGSYVLKTFLCIYRANYSLPVICCRVRSVSGKDMSRRVTKIYHPPPTPPPPPHPQHGATACDGDDGGGNLVKSPQLDMPSHWSIAYFDVRGPYTYSMVKMQGQEKNLWEVLDMVVNPARYIYWYLCCPGWGENDCHGVFKPGVSCKNPQALILSMIHVQHSTLVGGEQLL